MLKFNRLFPLFLALFLPIASFAQGVVVSPQTALKTVNGATSPIAGATITVCAANTSGLPCSPALAGVTFKDAALTVPLANPFTADANGNYNFAIAAGTYTVTVTASGFSGYTYQISVTCPPAGPCSFTAITAASLNVVSLTVTGSANIPGRLFSVQTFTSNGTFTIPAGITSVKVTVIGAGGGGGGSDAGATFNGSGGGSGGSAIKWLSGLTPANTLTVTVGTGGTVTSGAAGGNGVASSVASGTQVITTITANGGSGGGSAAGVLVGGAGATAGTGGDLNLAGISAANAAPIATMSNWGGPGAASILGGGGGTVFAGAGVTGNAFGGGGSGAGGGAARAGGVGAAGLVIFEWVN